MTRLTLAHLTAIDLAPPALIHAAAEAGFDGVGLRLIRVTDDSPGYPLMGDPTAMRETLAALRDTGLTVPDIEFVKITPDFSPDTLRPVLETGAELGAAHVIMAPYDPDLSRLADRLAAVADLGAPMGIAPVLEFFPWTSVPDLATCWQVVQAAGPRVGLLPDALHFDRSGSTHHLLRQIPAERLPFAHLCDAPVAPPYTTEALLHTARIGRLAPGDGEIDLTSFISALPPGTPLGLEVPSEMPGPDVITRLRRLRDSTLALLSQVSAR